jgi:hypothetical protein
MAMAAEQLTEWRDQILVDIEHLRAVLAQPNDYFSPKGGQHWYQVISRSEIEHRLAHQMRMIDHIDAQLP